MATSTIKAQGAIQTWTPKLYDLDTYVRDLPNGNYIKIGQLVVAWFNVNNPNLSGVNTMMQIRNLPMSAVIGGSVYLANISGQGASQTIQNSVYLYLRPNVKSSNFTDPATPGWVSLFICGIA